MGMVRFLHDRKWEFPIGNFIFWAVSELKSTGNPASQIKEPLKEFILGRFQNWCESQGYRADEIEAVVSNNGQSLNAMVKKLEGLKAVRGRQEFGSLSSASKRARNILRQAEEKGVLPANIHIQPQEIQGEVEQSLYRSLHEVTPRVQEALIQEHYEQALLNLAPLKEPVDAFFEGVKVMDEDEKLRSQRLQLLMQVQELFDSLLDFSKLQPTTFPHH